METADTSRLGRGKLRLLTTLILLLSFSLPALAVHLTRDEPRERRINVDLFRYGMQPEVIHVNRGDRLILTFSTRDTAHSFFLQEYDIDAKVTPNAAEIEVVRPSDPHGDPEIVRQVEFTAGRPGFMGFFNTRSKFRDHVFCGAMHGFEQGVLVVHPNYLHAGATGLVFAIPLVGAIRLRWGKRAPPILASNSGGDITLLQSGTEKERAGVQLFKKFPWLKKIFKIPGLTVWVQTILSVATFAVVLIAMLGTTMAGANLAVPLVWIVWMTLLIAVIVPFGGRAWCTVCPLPALGDAIQHGTNPQRKNADAESGNSYRERGNSRFYNNPFRGMMLEWPKLLSNAATRAVVFLCFGTVSVLIISQPRWTGWAILSLIIAGTVLPLFFELRTFCRWLCPINSFISLYASMGKLALRANKPIVCEKCIERGDETCRKGDDDGFACPYGLTVADIDRNDDCGLCMECVKSCSYENITLRWRPFGLERTLRSLPEAWHAIIMFTLAVVYLVTFQGPWHSIRDMVNIVDKGNWDLFVVYTLLLWFTALAVVPLIVYLIARMGRELSGSSESIRELFIRCSTTFVPLGLFVWIAFAVPMFMVEGSFVLSTVSDPFGWGWDLFGTAGQPWWQIFPEAIPWFQAGMTLFGFALALQTAKRVWSQVTSNSRSAILGMLPISVFLLVLNFLLIWFYTG